MTIRALLFSLAVICAGAVHAQTPGGPSFPRLAIYAIGGPHDYYEPARQTELSRYNVVIINAYPGWEQWRGTTYDQIAKNLKAKNPKSKLFLYTFNNESDTNSDYQAAWPELLAALSNNKWWLYQDGVRAKSTFGTTHFLTNPTLFTPKDANGQRFVDWMPRYLVSKFNGTKSAIDGFYLDNTFWRPHRSGDWNNDGVTDDNWGNPAVGKWLRDGLRVHFQTLQTLMPGKMQMGNAVDWTDPNAVLTEYQGVLNGALLEGVIGVDWGAETSRGFQGVLTAYRRTMSILIQPKLGIIHMAGDPANYRELRYGLGLTLLDDGYFAYSRRTSASEFEVHDAVWFDEYDVPLGQATSTPPTTAWQKGVYRRDFENGIVLVNPKGNGPVDITLEQDFIRIAGKQDKVVNNGQKGKAVHLQDRDGIILLRDAAVKRPAPPSNLILQ